MHVAIIMDGNGRWAAQRQLPRSTGHRAGAKAVNKTVETAARNGIATLTLFAFSSANWQRPGPEVNALLTLLRRYLLTQTPALPGAGHTHQRDRAPRPASAPGCCMPSNTANGPPRTANGCGCGSQSIIRHSIRCCRHRNDWPARTHAEAGGFARHLGDVDHSATPAPAVDLLIRTGGEKTAQRFPAVGMCVRRAVLPGLLVARLRRKGLQPVTGGFFAAANAASSRIPAAPLLRVGHG